MATLRILVAVLFVGWAAYVAAMLRTGEVGVTPGHFLGAWVAALFFVAPFLPFVTTIWFLRRRSGVSRWAFAARWLAGTALAGALLAETFAASQEALVLSKSGSESGQPVVVRRWWPFEGHAMVFVPGRGWRGED